MYFVWYHKLFLRKDLSKCNITNMQLSLQVLQNTPCNRTITKYHVAEADW
jgi:hypothetical protein